MNWLKTTWKGLLVCLAIAVPCWFLGQWVPVVGGPVFAIVIGMALALLLPKKQPLQPGIAFASKKVLQYAVVLLGFGLNLQTVVQVGAQSLPIILATITTSLIIAFLLYKLLRIPSHTATLIGVGSSICGGSAVAATASVIDAKDEDVAQSISVIFLFNVIAALVFPTLGGLLGLSNEGFALFAGTAVNDTSSVTAAASAWDGIHGTGTAVLSMATIVKLTRTLAIIPITLAIALWRAKKAKGEAQGVKLKKIFPFFILFFILCSLITTGCHSLISAGVLSGGFADGINVFFDSMKDLSKFFIIVAMAAIGLNTNLVKLVRTGGKPILLGFCCWVGISGVSLLMQHILGIW